MHLKSLVGRLATLSSTTTPLTLHMKVTYLPLCSHKAKGIIWLVPVFSSHLPLGLQVLVFVFAHTFTLQTSTDDTHVSYGELGVWTQDELGPFGVTVSKDKGP